MNSPSELGDCGVIPVRERLGHAVTDRTLLWVDTRWACGGMWVRDGVIVGGAPIFRKFIGQPASNLRCYKVKEIP